MVVQEASGGQQEAKTKEEGLGLPNPDDIWFVYIVECADGTLYTGITNDVPTRVLKHNTGKGAKYTKKRRPVKLRYWHAYEGKGTALKEEARIKKLKRAEKEKLIFPKESEGSIRPKGFATI